MIFPSRKGKQGDHICVNCRKAVRVEEQEKELMGESKVKVRVAVCDDCGWQKIVY